MTLYLPSDVTGFSIHSENGGCGEPHTVEVNADGVRALDCPACEAAAGNGHGYGHSTNPKTVLATCDELAEQERADKDAQRVGTKLLASQILGVAAGQMPPGVAEQMAAMQEAMRVQAEQIAALTAQLSAAPSAGAENTPTVEAKPTKATKAATKKAEPTEPVS